MGDADALFRSGDLVGARAALVEVVRAQPANQQARMFLFQLFATLGEWDKARRQLSALAQLAPEAEMLSVAYGQAIDAEQARGEVFAGRARASLHMQSDWAEPLVEAIEHFANGRIDAGEAARAAAFDRAPTLPGSLDGTPFEWIGDADGRFGPAIELIIAGRYGLLPLELVERIHSSGAADLRDAIWYPVEIVFRQGRTVAGLIPVRYPGTEDQGNADERLARVTGWRDAGWGQAGIGQRLLALSTGEERSLLSLRALDFA